jgi:phage terminase small subunit
VKAEDICNLSTKHRLFCEDYALNGNASQAYIAAGYSKSGARQSALRLLTKPYIREYVEHLLAEIRKELEEKYNVTRDRILKERARIAFFRSDMLYKPDGTLKAPNEWGEDVSAVISNVKIKEIYEGYGKERTKKGEVIEVRTHSKNDCLQALERIEGMYEADNVQRNPYSNLTDAELEAKIAAAEAKRVTRKRN